jgi:hypothetical protein
MAPPHQLEGDWVDLFLKISQEAAIGDQGRSGAFDTNNASGDASTATNRPKSGSASFSKKASPAVSVA